jgi:hypothetical protein
LIAQFPQGLPSIDVMDNSNLRRYDLLDGQQRFAAFGGNETKSAILIKGAQMSVEYVNIGFRWMSDLGAK